MACEIIIDSNNDEYTIGVTGDGCGNFDVTVTASGEYEMTVVTEGTVIPTESDPVFVASSAYHISGEQIEQWKTAYGWGNHALNLYDTTGAAVTQRTQHEALFNHTNIHAAYSDAETASTIGTLLGGVSAATPVSGDKFPFVQAVGNTLKTITKSNLIAQIAADATFITTGDNISLLTNDVGFITAGDLTNDYEASGGIASHLLAFNHSLIAVYETSGEMSGHLTDYDHALINDIEGKKPYHGNEAIGAISFDNITHVFTVASGENTYWYQGDKYTTSDAITCDNDTYYDTTGTANALYYIAYEDVSGTLKSFNSFWNLKTKVPVATVYWNGASGAVQREYHNHERDLDWHINAHLTIGTRYYTGLSMTYPDTTHDAVLQIETGTIYDEDLPSVITQQTTMRGWYMASAGVYTWKDYNLPYLGSAGNPEYLNTGTYSLTPVADNHFVVYWYYATSDINRPVYVIPTHAANDYNTIALARSETQPALSGLALNPEWKLIYKAIYRGDGEFQEKTDYRTSSSLPSGGTALVSAAGVTLVPYGDIASSNVQAAIQELDDEKASTASLLDYSTTGHLHTGVYETSGALSGHLTDYNHAAFARVVTAPLSATGSGDAGTMALDSNYVYFCVSTNTWRRTPIANW